MLTQLGLLSLHRERLLQLRLVPIDTLSELSFQLDLNQFFLNLIVQVFVVLDEFIGKKLDIFDLFGRHLAVDICNLETYFDKGYWLLAFCLGL